MSDLPRHSICTERRKGADELEGACFNGWKSPVSTDRAGPRRRISSLVPVPALASKNLQDRLLRAKSPD
ncbi:hypothetical protein SNOG_06707 [Parastagonospora nodorum SN15]|uniref:Uncharacterized protein n=1 Tax=Phaeosphaeria nodorum (strain SN15 / ATCC MYA-4574 / FGSC 10173) TaxID=321614 RepID=Q0UNF7_PHANO|nr:hypothetical protein SNOG_06707 [Parastagonospora nodorum SN15]EAT85358.1 hypothetical protein SNOG_06707 [Parastagonospora nodorum SN15]